MSSLEKDRQDLQSTIDALQEGKLSTMPYSVCFIQRERLRGPRTAGFQWNSLCSSSTNQST